MPWTERQHAILAEMGLRLWSAPQPDGVSAGTPDPILPPGDEGPSAEMPQRAASVPAAPPAQRPDRSVRAAPAPVVPRATGDLDARAAGVATLDWPQLLDAVAGCTACGLCEGRRQTVFGVGHPQAQWMIIGEAPGEQEDQQGEPFVGKAGQLLDRMLLALGLSRLPTAPAGADVAMDAAAARQVYIANVLKCRPPGNRNPTPQEVAQCEPFLKRQVALVRPRIILAMGKFAVQSLLQTQEPIGRLRGRVHQYEGVPVIVTYHPAYLLRTPLDKARSWEDLCLAASVMEAGGG